MKKIVGGNRLLIKCCKLYYMQSMTQNEISKTLGISRPTVSRLLKEAMEKGIVKIEIQESEQSNYEDLESSIEKKYGLKEVLITNDNEEGLTSDLGCMAAKYLERIIRNTDIIGVSMGTTVKEIGRFVSKGSNVDAMFVPLIGGVGQIGIDIHPNEVAMSLSRAFNGKFKLLHVPAIISDTDLIEKLKEEKSVSDVLEYINKVNISIVGIGAPTEKSTMMASGYFDKEKLENLKRLNAVGDICLQFFDINGNSKQFKDNSKVFGSHLEDIKNIDRVIGVAGGDEKVEAIIGAINGRFINVLITNYSCAKLIFNYKVGE
ncbi:sugar-binding transcriptional regulator [Clostridium psychrophilum]|uniref:sugar-binding transcriptional regulator n=1 Tax=Clostridium psychrophilum TaxID=132926 RepID=UPI001C0E3762|nr:sugar-binding transcriptional regulator [Clostridium psychrophilum]MBU3179802.1 sugar-binding transcriptional regulator [Clostridium psychrophilum]